MWSGDIYVPRDKKSMVQSSFFTLGRHWLFCILPLKLKSHDATIRSVFCDELLGGMLRSWICELVYQGCVDWVDFNDSSNSYTNRSLAGN